MTQPNVIFIFADQLRYDSLGCNGNGVVQTPAIDSLASEGVVFDQAYSSCPICSPYRGQLLTGCYSHTNGVMCNEYQFFDGQRTLAHRFGEAGYKTAYIGKFHLGYGPYTPEKRYGFDNMLAYNNGHHYYDISYWRNEEGPFQMTDYSPRVETGLALDYIKNHIDASPQQPFCAVLSWGPPHWDCKDGEREYGEYPQEYNTYDKADIDVPDNVPIQMREFARAEIADYYGMVASIDDCMKRILDSLDEWGIADNTIVCFSSDHGDHLSAHGYGKPGDRWMHPSLRASKATPYEESIHIPFIMRYPERIKGAQRSDCMFSSVDVLPTLLGLCGISDSDGMQGRDLSHAALGEAGEEPDSVYLQILGPGWPTRTKWVGLWRGVRTHKYTYARWIDYDGKRVLFDRESDPLEMVNLAADAAYKDIVEQMETLLKRWIAETNDPFETGARLPVTEMLDLGQVLSSKEMHEHAPKQYAASIEKYRKD
jgi:arylsulfatase A-like enzyme